MACLAVAVEGGRNTYEDEGSMKHAEYQLVDLISCGSDIAKGAQRR